MEKNEEALFPLGDIVVTDGVVNEDFDELKECLKKHCGGNWGEVDSEDWKENNRSLKFGLRVLSAYTLTNGAKIWIITEADRSCTTILLPEEY